MKPKLKVFFSYWLEILLGLIIILVFDSTKWFLFYAFIVFLITMARLASYFRKLIRIHQFSNEIKILAITRKLKINDEEISIVTDSEKYRIGERRWKELEREMNELTEKGII